MNEQQLLIEWERCGFDWVSTASQLFTRFPIEPDWGVAHFEVVRYRLGRAFAELGTEWKIPVNRPLEYDLPPTRYNFAYHPHASPGVNFSEALQKLAALFGPGESGYSKNVLERNWKVGFFRIHVITWPEELNRRSTNVFQGKNPYLWISANVSIEPELPFVEEVDCAPPLEVLAMPGDDYSLDCGSQVYARRNRLPCGEWLAGLTGDTFIVQGPDRTMRVPMAEIDSVTHLRLTPGRRDGESSIALKATYLGRHAVTVTVARGNATESLDAVAPRLAKALAKPFTVEEYPDE